MNKNPRCCGGHCAFETGEVRKLPQGDNNLILCRQCFGEEMIWRRQRNADLKRLKTGTSFLLPLWRDLEVVKDG